MNRILALCIIYYCISYPCRSQDTVVVSLSDCLNRALTENYDILSSQKNLRLAELQKRDARMNIIPELAIATGLNYQISKSADNVTYQYVRGNSISQNLGVNASMNVFNGLQYYYGNKQADIQLEISGHKLNNQKIVLMQEIVSIYLDIILKQEMLLIQNKTFDVLSSQVERARKLVSSGKLRNNDLLVLRSDQISEKFKIEEAISSLNESKFYFMQVVNYSDPSDILQFKYVIDDISSIVKWYRTETYESVLSKCSNLHPQLLIKAKELESEQCNYKRTKKSCLPRVSVNAGYSTNYYSTAPDSLRVPFTENTWKPNHYNDQLNNNLTSSAGISVSIPINGYLNYHRTNQKAKLQVENSELQYRKEYNQLSQTIQKLLDDVILLDTKIKVHEEEITLNREIFRVVAEQFNAGTVDATQYLIAQNNLAQSESYLSIAKATFLLNLTVLEIFTGRKPQIQ